MLLAAESWIALKGTSGWRDSLLLQSLKQRRITAVAFGWRWFSMELDGLYGTQLGTVWQSYSSRYDECRVLGVVKSRGDCWIPASCLWLIMHALINVWVLYLIAAPWLWAENPHVGHSLYLPVSMNCVNHILFLCIVHTVWVFSKAAGCFFYFIYPYYQYPSLISPYKRYAIHTVWAERSNPTMGGNDCYKIDSYPNNNITQ